jgi:hypothetical protein
MINQYFQVLVSPSKIEWRLKSQYQALNTDLMIIPKINLT